MRKIKFELRISLAYLIIGGLWIIFSDKVLHFFVNDTYLLTELQTYKGWFYVVITAFMFFIFLKNHLNRLRFTENELKKHKDNLQQLVNEKTSDLLNVNTELKITNNDLFRKTDFINKQNSELEAALENLKETQSQLVQSEKMASLGTLTAGVAHEINNPLNYIMGSYVGLKNYFKKYGSNEDDKTFRMLENMHIGIKKASNIVKSLDQLSKNRINYNETCDVHLSIDNCLLILEDQVSDNIKIVRDYCDEEMIVKGNVANLHRALTNVLSNAFQAIKGKGCVTIHTKTLKEWNEVVIIDDGCGIRKEDISKITDPFFTTKPTGEGTGLGLSITYSIIKEHKGIMNFESEINKGTKVSILLPKIVKI